MHDEAVIENMIKDAHKIMDANIILYKQLLQEWSRNILVFCDIVNFLYQDI